jgi:hypothetical protein
MIPNPGGMYIYRATVTCSLCGRSEDVGPFDAMKEAWQWQYLSGWTTPGGKLSLADSEGNPVTLCPDCAGRKSLNEILNHCGYLGVKER